MLHLLTHIHYAVQLYRKFEQSRQYRRVLAVTGGVIASVIVAPLLSLLSVGKSYSHIILPSHSSRIVFSFQ